MSNKPEDALLSIANVTIKTPMGGELEKFDLAAGIFRHCGVEPDDDWVKRVERLNAQIDHLHKILKQQTGKAGYCFMGVEHPDGSVSVTVPASFVPDELKVEL